nr:recombination protein NinG [uncultured Draconibacterium sp.]
MNTVIKESVLIPCTEPDCETEFRWNGKGIKPKRCHVCENRIALERQHKAAKKYQEKRRKQAIERSKNSKYGSGRGKESIHANYPKTKTRIKKQIRVKPQVHNFEVRTETNALPKKKGRSWTELPTNQLITYVQLKVVNPYIRKRDKDVYDNHCISCNTGRIEEAGHFYSVGSTPEMRFMPEDIHGQCHHCNSLLGSNPKGYNKGLIARHGQRYVHELHKLHAECQKSNTKLLRNEIIEIANTYKFLSKEKIWVFTSEEFNQYLNDVERA